MWAVRARFKFWVCLGCKKPWVPDKFNHFHNASIGGESGEQHSIFYQNLAVFVVDLIAVSVPFGNGLVAIEGIGLA